MLPIPAAAQQLNGVWQGVEISPPKTDFYPAVLTVGSYSGETVTGVLYEEVQKAPGYSATFRMSGTVKGNVLQLSHSSVLQESSEQGYGWCQGVILFTYDATEEKLSGRAMYRPSHSDCDGGLYTLYRVRLKSPATVLVAVPTTLRVTGQQVHWYADAALQHPLATGNEFRTKLSKTTTFYLTQGFFPTHRPAGVPITIRVAEPATKVLAKKQPTKAAPRPARAAAPVVLPTVLFHTTTAQLLPESAPVLDKLAQSLKARPAVQLRIAGHTDQIGEAAKNQVLSEQRAQAVKQYLVQAGIAPQRLKTVGYGHSRLLYPTPDVRNRRVEIEETP
ncbi:OmpA family protein [Hymenobacter cellulosivorans]|uniref:OmpA family protein n=1 Tax=Hymenobacter cellulosivorans TaxID=2932249 RepID=A0ABY4F5M6_9BACT|nr:OmpA family protein [Hymenobacter cellulosivorans]UOQ51511.1 OmpA family protein [Hymenobacter cellulosivorans]